MALPSSVMIDGSIAMAIVHLFQGDSSLSFFCYHTGTWVF